MISAFYTAASGVTSTQTGLDVISNNIANLSTNGYRSGKASFADLIYTNMRAAEGDTKAKVGHGSKINKTDIVYTQGAYVPTQRMLDYAVGNERGFFGVETPDGMKYTRSGNFEASEIDGTFYLTAMQGGFVLDSNGNRIEITAEGEYDIGVYEFPNSDGLMLEKNLFFSQTAESGEAVSADNSGIKQGYLEGSNVDMAQVMSEVIVMQRSFQFNSRMVQISDEIMQTVNALRS